MEMAEAAAKRSTCFRGNNGALVVVGNNVKSIGYNGPPSGEVHCEGHICAGSTTGCERSLHAERNALARNNCAINQGADIYCTAAPCPNCAALICLHGIARVFYRHPYRLNDGVAYLLEHDVKVYRVSPSGYIIEERTGKLVTEESL